MPAKDQSMLINLNSTGTHAQGLQPYTLTTEAPVLCRHLLADILACRTPPPTLPLPRHRDDGRRWVSPLLDAVEVVEVETAGARPDGGVTPHHTAADHALVGTAGQLFHQRTCSTIQRNRSYTRRNSCPAVPIPFEVPVLFENLIHHTAADYADHTLIGRAAQLFHLKTLYTPHRRKDLTLIGTAAQLFQQIPDPPCMGKVFLWTFLGAPCHDLSYF